MGSKVYVGNLPFDVDEKRLRMLFEEGGREVLDVKIVTDRDTGRPRGFAFVDMASDRDAQAAISALNGKDLGGRTLTVSEAHDRPARRGGFGGGGFNRGGRGDRGARGWGGY
ncbi:MAG: RNA-binding protein [candidate division NC10 bacterium]|nr:RNA-binding protein [candidate division NC10 bacterium]